MATSKRRRRPQASSTRHRRNSLDGVGEVLRGLPAPSAPAVHRSRASAWPITCLEIRRGRRGAPPPPRAPGRDRPPPYRRRARDRCRSRSWPGRRESDAASPDRLTATTVAVAAPPSPRARRRRERRVRARTQVRRLASQGDEVAAQLQHRTRVPPLILDIDRVRVADRKPGANAVAREPGPRPPRSIASGSVRRRGSAVLAPPSADQVELIVLGYREHPSSRSRRRSRGTGVPRSVSSAMRAQRERSSRPSHHLVGNRPTSWFDPVQAGCAPGGSAASVRSHDPPSASARKSEKTNEKLKQRCSSSSPVP